MCPKNYCIDKDESVMGIKEHRCKMTKSKAEACSCPSFPPTITLMLFFLLYIPIDAILLHPFF